MKIDSGKPIFSSRTSSGTSFRWLIALLAMATLFMVLTSNPEPTISDVANSQDKQDATSKILKLSRADQLPKAESVLAEVAAEGVLDRYESQTLLGQMLLEHQRYARAEEVFKELVRTHPQHPEAYNNYAVALAKQGKNKRALDILTAALSTNASYGKIYENLRSITGAMASESYLKALDMEVKKSELNLVYLTATGTPLTLGETKPNASLLSSLSKTDRADEPLTPEQAAAMPLLDKPETTPTPTTDWNNTQPVTPTPTTAVPTLAAEPEIAPPPMPREQDRQVEAMLAQLGAQPATTGSDPLPQPFLLPNQSDSVQDGMVLPTQNRSGIGGASMPLEAPAPYAEVQQQENRDAAVLAAVRGWERAWESKDVNSYIDAYVRNYAPPGSSHTAWRNLRSSRITRARNIRVTLSDIRINFVAPDIAEVEFSQRYQAANYQDREQKKLTLIEQNGSWRIREELVTN